MSAFGCSDASWDYFGTFDPHSLRNPLLNWTGSNAIIQGSYKKVSNGRVLCSKFIPSFWCKIKLFGIKAPSMGVCAGFLQRGGRANVENWKTGDFQLAKSLAKPQSLFIIG